MIFDSLVKKMKSYSKSDLLKIAGKGLGIASVVALYLLRLYFKYGKSDMDYEHGDGFDRYEGNGIYEQLEEHVRNEKKHKVPIKASKEDIDLAKKQLEDIEKKKKELEEKSMSTLKKMLIGASGILLIAILAVLAYKYGYSPPANVVPNHLNMDDEPDLPLVPRIPDDAPPFRPRRKRSRPGVQSLDTTTTTTTETETDNETDNRKYRVAPFNQRFRTKQLKKSAKTDPNAHLELEADMIDPEKKHHLSWSRYKRAPALGIDKDRQKLDDHLRLNELFERAKKNQGKIISKDDQAKKDIGEIISKMDKEQKEAQEKQKRVLSEMSKTLDEAGVFFTPDGALMPKEIQFEQEDVSDREREKRKRYEDHVRMMGLLSENYPDSEKLIKEHQFRKSQPYWTKEMSDQENEDYDKYRREVERKAQKFDFDVPDLKSPIKKQVISEEALRKKELSDTDRELMESFINTERQKERKHRRSYASSRNKNLSKQEKPDNAEWNLYDPDEENRKQEKARKEKHDTIQKRILEDARIESERTGQPFDNVFDKVKMAYAMNLASGRDDYRYIGGSVRKPIRVPPLPVPPLPVQQNISDENKKKIILDMFKLPIEVLKTIASATIPILSSIAIFILTIKLKSAVENYIDEYDYGNQQEGVPRFQQFPDPSLRYALSAAGKYTARKPVNIPKPEIIKIEKELKKTPIEILKKIAKYALPAVAVIASSILISRLVSNSDAEQRRINDNWRIFPDDDFDFDGDNLLGTGKNIDPKTNEKIKSVFDNLMNSSLESLKYTAKYAGGFLARIAMAVIVAKVSGKMGFNQNEVLSLIKSIN